MPSTKSIKYYNIILSYSYKSYFANFVVCEVIICNVNAWIQLVIPYKLSQYWRSFNWRIAMIFLQNPFAELGF